MERNRKKKDFQICFVAVDVDDDDGDDEEEKVDKIKRNASFAFVAWC